MGGTGRVVGFGGAFVKVADPAATRDWYARALGLSISPWGSAEFRWKDAETGADGRSVWSPLPADTDYFAPSDKAVMLNFLVDDLDLMLARLREQDVPLVGEVLEESYGRFAWFLDPDGVKIEIWQPLAPPPVE
jgi:catechol 2,3-dioxygenase-like lactoylglutathione lyase family enzyme